MYLLLDNVLLVYVDHNRRPLPLVVFRSSWSVSGSRQLSSSWIRLANRTMVSGCGLTRARPFTHCYVYGGMVLVKKTFFPPSTLYSGFACMRNCIFLWIILNKRKKKERKNEDWLHQFACGQKGSLKYSKWRCGCDFISQ